MSTPDLVSAVLVALVTALVCAAFVARTRAEPPTLRAALALAGACGLSALVVVLAVHLVPLAGQGDPLGTLGDLVQGAVRAVALPSTLLLAALAAAVGLAVGGVRVWRGGGDR